MRVAVGLVVAGLGVYLTLCPLVTADLLDRPHATSTQLINLRATWGGTLLGLGLFAMWLPALRPWLRAVLGLLMCSMAGIGAARLVGFAVDGHPDTRQYIWITAEVIGCAWRLRVAARGATHDDATIIGDEVEALYTNGPAGGGGTRRRSPSRSASYPR